MMIMVFRLLAVASLLVETVALDNGLALTPVMGAHSASPSPRHPSESHTTLPACRPRKAGTPGTTFAALAVARVPGLVSPATRPWTTACPRS